MRTFKQGWGAPVDYELTRDGSAFDATGLTAPTLTLISVIDGLPIPITGSVSWLDITASTVRWIPGPTDLSRVGKYRATFTLDEGSGKYSMYPAESDEIWEVRAL